MLHAATDADVVIVGTLCADQDPAQAALVNGVDPAGQAANCGRAADAIRPTRLPQRRDLPVRLQLPPGTSVEAVARVLFGEIEARGVLPCSIPGIAGSAEMLPA